MGRFLVGAFHQQARKQRKGGIQSRAAAAELLLEKRSVILRRGGLREAYSPAELEQLLTFGNAVGALSVQRYGAIPSIPTLAETESFLRAQGLLGA